MLKRKTINMKKYILPVVFSLMVVTCCGQRSASASISIDPSFLLSCNFHGKEDGDWIHKISQLKVMVLDGKKAADAEQWTKLSKDLHDGRFEDLLSIRKGSDRMQLMSRDGKDGLKEVAFLAGDKEGGLYIQFAGKFTQQDLDQMQSSLQSKD
jgi:hypothetical protein